MFCKDTLKQFITIHPEPIIEIVFNDTCEGPSLIFYGETNRSKFSTYITCRYNCILRSVWIFETDPYYDWNTLTIPTNDLEPGYYTIDLFMESQWTSVPGGCKAFKRDSILIKDAPDISNIDIMYSIDPPCGDNIEVTINAETESTNYTEITINDFPEDTTFNSFPVNHILDFPLVYPVDIHLTNEIGCETDSTILLHTFPEPTADFIISPTRMCTCRSSF